jgi:hypothetical protein
VRAGTNHKNSFPKVAQQMQVGKEIWGTDDQTLHMSQFAYVSTHVRMSVIWGIEWKGEHKMKWDDNR